MVDAWQGSTRRDRLPPDWPTIRTRILNRDPICQCRGCHRCTPDGCPANSTDVDHIIPVDDHTDTNLQGLCKRCHLAKSSSEGVAARRRIGTITRPREQHPGIR